MSLGYVDVKAVSVLMVKFSLLHGWKQPALVQTALHSGPTPVGRGFLQAPQTQHGQELIFPHTCFSSYLRQCYVDNISTAVPPALFLHSATPWSHSYPLLLTGILSIPIAPPCSTWVFSYLNDLGSPTGLPRLLPPDRLYGPLQIPVGIQHLPF